MTQDASRSEANMNNFFKTLCLLFTSAATLAHAQTASVSCPNNQFVNSDETQCVDTCPSGTHPTSDYCCPDADYDSVNGVCTKLSKFSVSMTAQLIGRSNSVDHYSDMKPVSDVTGKTDPAYRYLDELIYLHTDGTLSASSKAPLPSSGLDSVQNVKAISSTETAFAALKQDGSVVTWGNSDYGGDSSVVASELERDVQAVYSTAYAFAALKDNGKVVAWGDSYWGGTAPTGVESDVKAVSSTLYAFAALKNDGSVVAWGSSSYGGNAPTSVTTVESGVQAVYSTAYAFAALKEDGSVVAWGSSSRGGSAPTSVTTANSNVQAVSSTEFAFAALKDDGSVVAWGNSDWGGSAPTTVTTVNSNVQAVSGAKFAFAALKDDGSVVAWGHTSFGGDIPDSFSAELQNGVVAVYGTELAFAALKDDGNLFVWNSGVSFHVDKVRDVTVSSGKNHFVLEREESCSERYTSCDSDDSLFFKYNGVCSGADECLQNTDVCCTADCPLKLNVSTNECVSECAANQYRSIDGKKCVNSCGDVGELTPLDINDKQCKAGCGTGEYKNVEQTKCLSDCANENSYTPLEGNQCLSECSFKGSLEPLFGYECVSQCAAEEFKNFAATKCVDSCASVGELTPLDSNDKQCKTECGTGEYENVAKTECLSDCADENNNFTPEEGNQCVASCSNYISATVDTQCVSKCAVGEYLITDGEQCQTLAQIVNSVSPSEHLQALQSKVTC